jgi:hypothetical protein
MDSVSQLAAIDTSLDLNAPENPSAIDEMPTLVVAPSRTQCVPSWSKARVAGATTFPVCWQALSR